MRDLALQKLREIRCWSKPAGLLFYNRQYLAWGLAWVSMWLADVIAYVRNGSLEYDGATTAASVQCMSWSCFVRLIECLLGDGG